MEVQFVLCTAQQCLNPAVSNPYPTCNMEEYPEENNRRLIMNIEFTGAKYGKVHSSFADTLRHTHLSYGLVNCSEGGLLVVVVNPPVPMQHVDAVLLSWSTVAPIDAMIRTIIPLARKLQQHLCKWKCQTNTCVLLNQCSKATIQ